MPLYGGQQAAETGCCDFQRLGGGLIRLPATAAGWRFLIQVDPRYGLHILLRLMLTADWAACAYGPVGLRCRCR